MADWHVSQHESIDVEDLKARCDLRQIMVPHLEKARQVSGGDYWRACCPFHDDKKPSLLIFKEYYRCQSESCGEWGSVVDWFSHLNPGLEWWDLLKLISDDCGSGTVSLPAKRIKIEVPQEEPLPEPMNPKVLNDYDIGSFDHILDWVRDKWFLSKQTVLKERIGYNNDQKAIVIPIWGFNGELITLRFRNHANPKMGKYWGIAGRNDVYGYGREWIRNASEAIIVMGEMTACFLHHEWGFATFSWTNGCKSFKPYLKPLLAHLRGGIIVPDVGEDNSAAMVANMLGGGWKVALLEDVGGKEKEDVVDWAKRIGPEAKELFSDLILNRATSLQNGILPYWGSRLNAHWRR